MDDDCANFLLELGKIRKMQQLESFEQYVTQIESIVFADRNLAEIHLRFDTFISFIRTMEMKLTTIPIHQTSIPTTSSSQKSPSEIAEL